MGIFLRKSFRAGPMRFNISKSGIGISAGVKGLRVGAGPRGIGISGGRKGVYFRKSLSSGLGRASSSVPANFVNKSSSEKRISAREVDRRKNGETPVTAGGGGYAGVLALFVIGAVFLFNSLYVIAAVLVGLGLLVWWAMSTQTKRFNQHEAALARLTNTEDKPLLEELEATAASFNNSTWQLRHQFIYGRIFDSALEDGIDDAEISWLRIVAEALGIKPITIHVQKIKERMWEFMVDGVVTEEEEKAILELLRICEVPQGELSRELSSLRVMDIGIAPERQEALFPEFNQIFFGWIYSNALFDRFSHCEISSIVTRCSAAVVLASFARW